MIHVRHPSIIAGHPSTINGVYPTLINGAYPNPLLQQIQSLRGQTHESCSDITRIGIVFYNKKGIMFHKSERTRYSQINFTRHTFTQYKIPLEPKFPDETDETACKRIFKNITGITLNNKDDERATAHKRRHRNGLCSLVYVIKTTQDLTPPSDYTFLPYNEMLGMIKGTDDGQLLDYKLFSDLVEEKRLTQFGEESSGTDGKPSDDEVGKAITFLFDIEGDELKKLINKFNRFASDAKIDAFDGMSLALTDAKKYDEAQLKKAINVLGLKLGQIIDMAARAAALPAATPATPAARP